MIPTATPSPRSTINLRRAAVVAAGIGAASFVVMVPAGYPLAAAFFCAGLALGLLNTTLVQRSAARFAAMGDPSKKRFAGAVLGRLALITVLALGIAVLVQPEGLGVFAGLAAFQFMMIFLASVPLLRELRAQSAIEDESGADQSGVKV
jgi:hypothetical protein